MKTLYAYDPIDLDSKVEGIDEENSFWKREKVSLPPLTKRAGSSAIYTCRSVQLHRIRL